MLCCEVLGNLGDHGFAAGLGDFDVDHVDIDWHEAFKKLHRKTSEQGREVGIRLGDWVLSRGLSDGDVLGVVEGEGGCGADGRAAVAGAGAGGKKTVVAVRLLPTKCLVVDVAEDHPFMLAKVGWEVGNTHTPLFYGEGAYQVLCEYSEPLERLLSGAHAVELTVAERVLDPARRVSARGHHHPHGEGHHHGEGGHGHDHGSEAGAAALSHGRCHDHDHGPSSHGCCHGHDHHGE